MIIRHQKIIDRLNKKRQASLVVPWRTRAAALCKRVANGINKKLHEHADLPWYVWVGVAVISTLVMVVR